MTQVNPLKRDVADALLETEGDQKVTIGAQLQRRDCNVVDVIEISMELQQGAAIADEIVIQLQRRRETLNAELNQATAVCIGSNEHNICGVAQPFSWCFLLPHQEQFARRVGIDGEGERKLGKILMSGPCLHELLEAGLFTARDLEHLGRTGRLLCLLGLFSVRSVKGRHHLEAVGQLATQFRNQDPSLYGIAVFQRHEGRPQHRAMAQAEAAVCQLIGIQQP